MDLSNVISAFIMTLIAGISTGFGSFIVFSKHKTSPSFLSFILGFSAGVMIYISMIELFDSAKGSLTSIYGSKVGLAYTVLSFFGGMLLIAIIDRCIPEKENPHEMENTDNIEDNLDDEANLINTEEENSRSSENKNMTKSNLYRVSIITTLAIAIHNFPEGIATFMTALGMPTMAIAITIAIALHNIPEGMTVAILVFHSTGSKLKAFIWSFLSGLAEFIGALIAYLILSKYLNDTILAIILAAVGGIMVFISLDELLPAAEKYEKHHFAIYGVVTGMIIMAISLILFA